MKNTCHNIKQLTYEKTHMKKKQENMPQNKATHIRNNTCCNHVAI